MRRVLCLGLLTFGLTAFAGTAGAAALSALGGTAGAAAPSEGSLSIKRGDGRLTLDLRGAIFGRLGRGELDVLIPASRSCESLKVWGAEEYESVFEPIAAGEPVYICSFGGSGIRFRLVGEIGLEVRKGRGLFLSAVGRGIGEIDGAGGTDGVWSLDGAEPRSLPNSARRFTVGRPIESDST